MTDLTNYPPSDRWDDWTELDAKAWPEKKTRNYRLVPTICFNCEAACGLLAYIDKDTGEIAKIEGNPAHPASRGRNCAKGPATINQVYDPERIMHPMKRVGSRGSGQWEQVSWDQALGEIGDRIGTAFREDRHDEIIYHVGRPGDDSYVERVLHAWGVDAHNSHTNICSSGARVGYATWMGFDRPSADYANAEVIFLISSHLEAGHYFNPHAQRIMEAKKSGATIICVDPRLSNTGSVADHWLPAWPGTEAFLLLSLAHLLLEAGTWDRDFFRRWVNWDVFLRETRPDLEPVFENVERGLRELYAEYTPEAAEAMCGVGADELREIATVMGRHLGKFASHNWRASAAGNEGGWQTARCLQFLNVLTGSVGTVGGTSPNGWNKFIPMTPNHPEPQARWNELNWPMEYPLAHHEMSILLPYFLKEGRAKVDTYISRVYNPIWTNPDGFTWLEVLQDEELVGCHVALTPTWSETAWFADYVLPMGLSPERHDITSYETHSGRWIGFRQPVFRRNAEAKGKPVERTYEANPGEVSEENEFWIDLSFKIDPDGDLGIRPAFESPSRPGEPITLDEYYAYVMENSIPGLPEVAAAEDMTPLEYMKKYGAFAIPGDQYEMHERTLDPGEITGTVKGDDGVYRSPRTAGLHDSLDEIEGHMPFIGDGSVGVDIEGEPKFGWPTPSRKLEFYSSTMRDWGWDEYTMPTFIKSHVHWQDLDLANDERILLPTFRIPTLIHTRSANSKWLNEISHRHPLWIHPSDAEKLGISEGGLVRIATATGHFVISAWRTEGIRPGVVAASHHMGRWRLDGELGRNWGAGQVTLTNDGSRWLLRRAGDQAAHESADPDTSRIWWRDTGVHQNLTFVAQPDPISGMHCWHQRVRVTPAESGDEYGDIVVDTDKSFALYQQWLAKTRPGPGPGPNGEKLRRPLWFARPVKPKATAYRAG
ncbi:MAG: molybdopterin-dependent oxidoreductase [Acidimicrobiia bacterium]|nr:molybdopterin-dependent oxidoreductase [Acidimicrobiia bacterium]